MSKEKETAEATAEATKSPFWYIEGTPMAIHANMKFGDFRPFGDKEQAFTKFKMQLVGWRFFKSKMYVKTTDDEKNINELIKEGKTKEEAFLENQKKQTKDWAELYFFKNYDPKNKNPLCVMLIKTYSLANFVNEIRKFFYVTTIDDSGQERLCQMTDLVFDVSVKEATNQKGQFFAIDFKSALADKEVVNQISKFLDEGHKIYDSQNINENIRNSDTYKALPNTKNWVLPDIENRAFLLGEKQNLVLNEQN